MKDLNDAAKTNRAMAVAAVTGNGAEVFTPLAQEQAVKNQEAQAAELNSKAPHIGDFIAKSVALMKARANKEAKPIPLPWTNVTKALGGGLWPGLHVLTGATGQGKTQLALQVAWAAARAEIPVLYIGLELGELDISARLLALAEGDTGRKPPMWSDLYLGNAGTRELERLETVHTQTLKEMHFRAEFGPPMGWESTNLHNRVGAMRAEFPEQTPGSRPMLVVLDYLQAIGGDDDLRERIGRAAYAGRAVARDFGAAVLMLSSVSRENAKRARIGSEDDPVVPDETPASELVGMGKESGEIEYAADSVMALVSGDWDDRKKEKPMHLAVAKVRAGTPSWCALDFNGSTFREGLTRGS